MKAVIYNNMSKTDVFGNELFEGDRVMFIQGNTLIHGIVNGFTKKRIYIQFDAEKYAWARHTLIDGSTAPLPPVLKDSNQIVLCPRQMHNTYDKPRHWASTTHEPSELFICSDDANQ